MPSWVVEIPTRGRKEFVEMSETKKRLLKKHPSEDAVKLANRIYYTSLQKREPYVYISINALCRLLNKPDAEDCKLYLTALLEELTEPVAVKDFIFNRKKIDWQVISFITYAFTLENGEEYVDIEIDPMFIEVMKAVEAEPYINFQ